MARNRILSASDDAFLRARIGAVYAMSAPIMAMDLLGAGLIAWVYWRPATANALTLWLVVNALILVPRGGVALAYRAGRFPRAAVRLWARSLVFFASAAGLMWAGVLVWMVATGNDNQVMYVMCVVLGGLTLTIANIAYWPVYAAYVVPVTTAISLGFVLSDRPGHVLLAGGALATLIALLTTSRRLARDVLRAQRLAIDNQALVESLGERGRELEQACHALERVSRTDPLTGLANRRSCDARLAAEWARALRGGGSLAVIAIDVDRFKRYNDTHGHAEGDRCLQAVGDTLQACLRGAGDMAARHGGEEFMLILPGITAAAATSIAERVRAKVAGCGADPAVALPEPVTVSLGIAVIEPTPERSVEELTAIADAALYRAKLAGRNRYEMGIDLISAVAAA